MGGTVPPNIPGMVAPTIAAVFIVRNEAARLAACLEALAEAVDEIVVVDTGSTDDTRDVARRFTDNVYSFAWNDDFAAARNAALQHASADWVLVADADEVLQAPAAAAQRLRAFAGANTSVTIGTVAMHSPTGPEPDATVTIDHLQRFFRRGAWRFEGRIHEQPECLVGVKQAAPTGVAFWHSGYAQSHDDPLHKAHRNIRLLESALAETPEDEYLWYQLGKAHYSLRDYAGAAEALEKALGFITFIPDQPPRGSAGPVARAILTDLVVSLAYAYANTERLHRAEALLSEHSTNGHPGTQRADFHHVCGYIALMQGRIADAREAYETSLQFGPQQEDVMGTGSFASHYHLGLLAETEGPVERAMGHYTGALQLKADYGPALARVADLIVEQRVAPSRETLAQCDRAAWHTVYLSKLRDHLAGGNMEAVRLLTQAAAALDAELLEACKAMLRAQVNEL